MIGAGKDVTSAAADVVIVGGGGAGLTAALVAARLGRRVIVLEKNPVVGGTTAQSVGSITATCTPQQKAAGIDDDPQAHFEDMAAFAGPLANRDNIELRRLFVENVPDTMRFLADLGIEFIGPMPEPPHRQPRMHNILPHARGYTHHLLRHCRREGVIVRTGVRAERLLTDGGRVTGVSATTDTGVVAFRARRAVVLAAGDYSSSEEMKGSLANPTLAAIEGINQASTGDGHRLAVELGAEVVNGDVIWGPEIRFVPPPRPKAIARIPPYRVVAKGVRLAMQYLPDLVLRPFLMSFATTYLAPSQQMFEEGAILVNRAGLRFCDERDQPQWHLPAQPQRVAFVVFDRALAENGSPGRQGGDRPVRPQANLCRVWPDALTPPVLCLGAGEELDPADRWGPACGHGLARAWEGWRADGRPVRRRVDGSRRIAPAGTRAPSGLGLHLRPYRRPQRRHRAASRCRRRALT
jgi:fumarate reductase flavoprotein subunit